MLPSKINLPKSRNPSQPKNQTPQQQFIIRQKKRAESRNSKSSNQSNTSLLNSSIKPSTPRDGRVLEMLSDLDQRLGHLIEGKMKSFNVYNNNTHSLMAIEGDIHNPLFTRQIQYNAWYHPNIHQTLKNYETVTLANSLKRHKIQTQLRAKMVDWMLEVFGNYKHTTTNFTFFRAVNLMDSFLKHTQRVYQDCDLHLIGVGSMFLASKIEDIYHVPLQDMVKRVSHNKFSANAIKSIENEIVGAHLFNIYFPTHLNYLSFYFFKCFSISDNPQLINIYETAIYVMKMSLHDHQLMEVAPKTLAISSLCYSLHEYLNTKQDEGYTREEIVYIQDKSVRAVCDTCHIIYERMLECFQFIKRLVDTFQQVYPELMNLEKFG